MPDNRKVKRDSPWTTFYFITAAVLCVLGLVGIIMSFFLTEVPLIDSVFALGAGVQLFFCGFILQVFTDIRWYIQKCADQISDSSELNASRMVAINNKLDELTEKAEKTNSYLYHIYNK